MNSDSSAISISDLDFLSGFVLGHNIVTWIGDRKIRGLRPISGFLWMTGCSREETEFFGDNSEYIVSAHPLQQQGSLLLFRH